ncbi:MAG: GNAT family N-acetyltransferase [Betaproteobacteria bacterium]
MALIARCARWLFGEYSIYFVYRWRPQDRIETTGSSPVRQLTEQDLRQCRRALLANQAWYLGQDCQAFALEDEADVAAACFYWYGERYRLRGFWPLADGEAKLVQIVVDPSVRGRGLASRLIQGSADYMLQKGWSALYARIWHSNRPSLRAFERAGWQRIAFVAELYPLGTGRKRRIQINLERSRER